MDLPLSKNVDLKEESMIDLPAYIPGEPSIDQHGYLTKKYLEYAEPLEFLTQSFDMWIEKIIPRQLEAKKINLPITGEEVYFTSPYLERPSLSSNGTTRPLWPRTALENNLDLVGSLYATLVQVRESEVVDRRENVFLGKIPVPVGSKFENTFDLKDDPIALLSKGQCHQDPKGYFIIGGKERVILLHDKVAIMRPLVYLKKNKRTNKYNTVCSITNESFKGTNVVTILQGSNDELLVTMSVLGALNQINPFLLFSLLGMDDLQEAQNFILSFTQPKWRNRIAGKLAPTYLSSQNSANPVNTIAVYLSNAQEMRQSNLRIKNKRDRSRNLYDFKNYTDKQKKDYIVALIRRELFPQLPPLAENDTRRLGMLAQMMIRLLEYMIGVRPLDNRDDWSYKRLDPASASLRQLFQRLLDVSFEEIEGNINMRDEPVSLDRIAKDFNSTRVTEEFIHSVGGKEFGMKGDARKNIVDTLERTNLLDTYSHMTRIRVLGQEQSTAIVKRLVQPTSGMFICPAETPEKKKCGLIKNIVSGVRISIYDPDTDQVIIETVSRYLIQSPRLNQASDRCWFNGTFLGWCQGEELRKILVKERRNRTLYEETSITYNPRDQILWVINTGSRPIRPLLIVNSETGELVIAEKNLWLSDFQTLLNEGAVEWIDPYEQNHLLIAQTLDGFQKEKELHYRAYLDLLRAMVAAGIEDEQTAEDIDELISQEERAEIISGDLSVLSYEQALQTYQTIENRTNFTHVEFDPKMLGYVGSTIPLFNHNYSVRAGYHCHMGKKAVGLYHSHQRDLFPTSSKSLAYPSRGVLETRGALEIGLPDLPLGQLVVVAVMAESGWTQEDAIVINEAALQRGLLRYYLEFTKDAIESFGETRELIEYPPIRENEDKSLYQNLDKETGVIREGSLVTPYSAIIGMVRLRPDGTKENISVFAKAMEEGIVSRVLWTKSKEGHRMVKVKIRDSRIPGRGDKITFTPAQKATVGLVMAEVDMPRTASGVTPSIIINPLALPSRMTIGTLLEIVTSKAAVLTGSRVNATAFQPFDLDLFTLELERLGYNRYGDEELYSGITGRKLKSTVFTGVAYVNKLKHDVADKINIRSKGGLSAVTHAPMKGRTNEYGGAQKIDSMATDAMVGHGTPSILQERMCISSDAVSVLVCAKCETIASVSHLRDEMTCRQCGAKNTLGRVTIPYMMNVLGHTLQSMNMGVRYKVKAKE